MALEVEHLTGGYSQLPVLKDVSFNVQPGELVGLIDGEVVIIDEDDGETKKFPLQQVVRTSLAVVF